MRLLLQIYLVNHFFDTKKILIISRTSDKITKTVEMIEQRDMTDVKIVFKSGILEKRSKLRNYFEKNSNLITIPFYEDDVRSLTSVIITFINKHKIKLSRQSINLLVNRASGDRENLKIELEKILYYSQSNNKIEFEHVQKLTNLAENYGVSELADSCLSRNRKNVSKILNENNYTDDDCILILRTLLAKSKRLLTIIKKFNETENLDSVISNMKPPIFWKEKENIKKQAINWKINELKSRIYKINETEFLIKSNSRKSLNLMSDFIVNF
ncbi:DNA polymerase III subunit delta [Candidatus Pelagibacter sp.]|nr:DNA polymerase III subunit delta [Candidatus Pelagibacter sp.]